MTSPSFAHRKFPRLITALSAGLGLLMLSGCKLADKLGDVFNLHGHQSTMVTGGPVAKTQWDLFMVTVYVCTFIFIAVGSVLAYAQIKFRAKSTDDEHAEPPPQGHGNPFVEIGLIVASAGLLVIIAIPTLHDIWYDYDVPVAEQGNAMDLTATAYQWWFKFEYTSEMVKLPGGGETPLVTANELVIPAGVPIRIHLRSVDVIHSFWVPKLAGKVDMIPNRANFIWFEADKPGYFYGHCAEYCGEDHSVMRFRVIALSPRDYSLWLENQKKPARNATAGLIASEASMPHSDFAYLKLNPGDALSASPQFDTDPLKGWHEMQKLEVGENAGLIAAGRKLFTEKTCVSCHTIRGHEGVGIAGPDLTRVGARSTIAAGVLENSHDRMHAWIKNPNHFKPGDKMWFGGYNVMDNGEWKENFRVNDHDIDAIVAYLHSLK